MMAPADRTPIDRTPYDPKPPPPIRCDRRSGDFLPGALMPMLDTDELLVALAMTRCARDHLARQLPHNFVQDSPEQMALLQRMNMAFMQISVAAADMALALKQHMQPTIDIDFATGGQTA